MLKGFKDFIMRGNLIELAVAFIVGGAFASVVTTFTNVLMSFISKIGGQPDFGSVSIADVNVGRFLNAVIAFLIVSAVIYFFVVTPYNKLQARMARGEEPASPAPDIALLTEIRDLLAGRPGTSNVRGGGGLT
ncbi:MAG TPA: large conductance mechanosensitive channel protein MscL [Nocardioidaceae bacterium]|nr:large conductance mechanosensitive channel protein MscL [Nocardioidaceae bacterium]